MAKKSTKMQSETTAIPKGTIPKVVVPRGAVPRGIVPDGIVPKGSADGFFNETTSRVFQYITAWIPDEILHKHDSKGHLREKIHNCISLNYQIVYNRYQAEKEELEKKEGGGMNSRKRSGMTDIIKIFEKTDSIPGGDLDNYDSNDSRDGKPTCGLEELYNYTNKILSQKTDTGAIIGNGDTFSITRCIFKNNTFKPETVTDLDLLINIFDSELLNPVFHNHITKYLLKDMIYGCIINMIDRETTVEKEKGFYDSSLILKIQDKLDSFEIDASLIDADKIRDTLYKTLDIERVYTNGFNNAVNYFTTLLNNYNMGYQYIDYHANGNEVVIREYEETDIAKLPDENYRIRFRCFGKERLKEECNSFDTQLASLQTEVQRLWNIIEVIYQDSKSIFRVNDFEDLDKKTKSRVKKLITKKTADPLYDSRDKNWDEYTLIPYQQSSVEQDCNNLNEKDRIFKKLIRMRERFFNMRDGMYPVERKVMEERLSFLENEFARFDSLTNPHNLQSGIFLEINATSIKRKKSTFDSIAKVLNEFLNGLNPVFNGK